MSRLVIIVGTVLWGGSAVAQSPIVAVCEARSGSLAVMSLGDHPLLFDLVEMPAASVDHSLLGASYTAQPLGYYKFSLPPTLGCQALSIRFHEMRCDGIRCAGEATDIVPPSGGIRSVILRDDGTGIRKTVVDATWDLLNQVSWSVQCNQFPEEPAVLHLTDGVLSRTVTVSGTSVDDPDSQTIVVGAPPSVLPTAGYQDSCLQPPDVYPTPPPWTDVQTFVFPF